jgi:hypothetical protein
MDPLVQASSRQGLADPLGNPWLIVPYSNKPEDSLAAKICFHRNRSWAAYQLFRSPSLLSHGGSNSGPRKSLISASHSERRSSGVTISVALGSVSHPKFPNKLLGLFF